MKHRILLLIGALALVVAACGGGGDGDGGTNEPGTTRGAPSVGVSAAEGEVLYTGTCNTCHGEGGIGIDGLGKPLASSDFVKGLDDAALIDFIKVGRDTSDPENTSGVAMPPKGGNPSLSDADLESIVAYVRTLN